MAIEEEGEGVSAATGTSTLAETDERLVVPRFRSDFTVASGALTIDRLIASEAAAEGVASTRGAINELIGPLVVIDSVVGRVLRITGVGAMAASGTEDSGGDAVTGGVAGVETLAGLLDTTEPAVDGIDPTEEELAEVCVWTDWEPGSSANADSLSAVIRS
jgi:hypothetical protein